jgi:hypothetical protein
MGATAIARCKPTNSVANATQFLTETLREGIPKLVGLSSWKEKTELAYKAGDEYLNVQFGWKPFLSDLTDLGKAMVNVDKVLGQYERDAGGVVRRRYNFPSERNVQETSMGTGYPPGTSQVAWRSAGDLTRIRETVRNTWFSGAFTYYLPAGYDSRTALGNIAATAKAIGLDAKPETIWSLAPWSWAADWVTNTGDVISNLQDFANQGLIMRYGYIMEHSVVRDTYILGPCVTSSGEKIQASPITYVTETKVRRKANPFGFGVTWDGLSSFQASILAALGVTRHR